MDNHSVLIYKSKIVDSVISIAIPTYKRVDLLHEAIVSAINQKTTILYDVIVVDNNPERDDETERMMKQFKDHTLVSYYKNTSNIGMVGNWNQLFQLASGQWVAMLHDDDLLFPNYIEVIYKRLLELDDPYIVFPNYLTTSNRHLINCIPSGQFGLLSRKITLISFIRGNVIGPPIGMLVCKEFFLKNLRFKEDNYPSIDWHFYIEATEYGNIYRVSDILCLYYLGENESLKDSTIIGFYKNAYDMHNLLSAKLSFPFKIVSFLCYRSMIINTINWTSSIADEKIISQALCCIGYKRNNFLEMLSCLITKVFARFYERRLNAL